MWCISSRACDGVMPDVSMLLLVDDCTLGGPPIDVSWVKPFGVEFVDCVPSCRITLRRHFARAFWNQTCVFVCAHRFERVDDQQTTTEEKNGKGRKKRGWLSTFVKYISYFLFRRVVFSITMATRGALDSQETGTWYRRMDCFVHAFKKVFCSNLNCVFARPG